MFALGAVRIEVADVDGDGDQELLIDATLHGVEIRRADELHTVARRLVLPQAS